MLLVGFGEIERPHQAGFYQNRFSSLQKRIGAGVHYPLLSVQNAPPRMGGCLAKLRKDDVTDEFYVPVSYTPYESSCDLPDTRAHGSRDTFEMLFGTKPHSTPDSGPSSSSSSSQSPSRTSS